MNDPAYCVSIRRELSPRSRALAAVCLCVFCGHGMADTLATTPMPPNFYVTGFGSTEAYHGQTFRLPPGDLAGVPSLLEVFTGPSPDSGMKFRVLLTETESAGFFHPTRVLLESRLYEVAQSVERRIDRYEVPIQGVRLDAGRVYAWLLEYVPAAGLPGYRSSVTGLGHYEEGFSFKLMNGPFPPGGNREELFAQNVWFIDTVSPDYAFRLTYTAEPQPVSVLSIEPQGESVVLTWQGVWLLQQSAELLAWEDVPGATSPHVVTLDGTPRKFWRLRSP